MKVTRIKRDATLDLPSLRLEGGLFLPDQLAKAAHGLAAHQTEAGYHTPKGIKLKDDYSRAFQIGCAQWKHFAALLDRTDIDASEATTTFVTELLRDAFGYTGLVTDASIVIGERRYPVTLMAANRLPIIVAPHTLALDDPDPRFAIVGSGSRRKSAFQLAQELLNADPDHQWGLVSNGKTLRLLRDAAALTRPSFLEVDLQDLLGGQRLGEFASAWRLLHASRAGLSPGGESTPIVWEQWREDGQQEGTRVREGLREGVTQALLTLGTGFLQHPANDFLRRALQDGELSTDAYFQQLLRFVYRLIFVFSVEERGLLHPADDSAAALMARRLYAEGYALARLRNQCLKRRARNRFDDLWQRVRIVFRGLAAGEPRLALPALGGLFAPDQCAVLDAAALINAHLLQAVWYLRWARVGGNMAPVDYRNMGPEELGSVYESLLELVPEIDLPARQFGFIGLAEESTSAGNARKLTGSYYTPDSLVQELIKSALEPVIEQRLAANPAHPTEALLSIRVVDPACGSGHFLLAAARRLAEKLARLRAPDGPVKPQDYRHALREVIARCIFGVDRNPLALELARTALWLEGFEEGRPLSFIDHHLQCGDALLGLTDLKALERGIAKEAFKALSGDDKDVCKRLARINAAAFKDQERKRTASAFGQLEIAVTPETGLEALKALEALPQDNPRDIAAKEAAYQAFLRQARDNRLAHAADMAVGTFLLTKTADTEAQVPTSATLYFILTGEPLATQDQQKLDAVQTTCRAARVFHWPLAFPQVFAVGGFDCVLGNPPWERIKLQEEEFFATRHRRVAEAKSKAGRSQRIQWLSEGTLARNLHPDIDHLEHECEAEQRLYREFIVARRTAEAASVFMHIRGDDGGRYPLTGIGDVNTYALFAETISQIRHDTGRAGFIVPTGIATDATTKSFFANITQRRQLVSLKGLWEIRRVFPGTDSRDPFCLLTLGAADIAEFIFQAKNIDEFSDSRRRFRLTPEEFRLLNPNTLTCPVFRSERDAELTKKLYRTNAVLRSDDTTVRTDRWPVALRTMFHKSGDSGLFLSSQDASGNDLLPLYEGGLGHQFNCRYAEYRDDREMEVTASQLEEPGFFPATEWLIRASDFHNKSMSMRLDSMSPCKTAFLGVRRVARNTDERTAIACIFPWMPASNGWILSLGIDAKQMALLCAAYNSLVFDYLLRSALSQPSIPQGTFEQVAVPPLSRFAESDRAFVVCRVLELTYTANNLTPWAKDVGFEGAPFSFDLERRAVLRAELDALYARLYGLTRDELRYILAPTDVMGEDYPSETFRVLKSNEIKEFGEYRTQQLVLREFDRMALAEANGESYVSLLNPLPGQQAQPTYLPHGIIRDEIDARLAGLLLTMIRQIGRLPRRNLNDAVTMANQPALLGPFIDAEGAATIAAFRQRHVSIFDATRLTDGRLQVWLRNFESTGLIRMESQGDQLAAVPAAVMPGHLIVDEATTRVARLLLQATQRASAGAADEEQATGDSVRRA